MITEIKNHLLGRRILQGIFERLHRVSLRGMNYGLGGMISTSGEKAIVRLVSERLNVNGVVNPILFDVGANNGLYTKILLETFSKDAFVHCFEPSEYSFEKLKAMHGLKHNVKLVRAGLGSQLEKSLLYYDIEGSGWASVYERKDTGFNRPLTNSEEIEIITLDKYCLENNINRINFLKADVEGFELEVLKGAMKMLPNIDFIQFEFSYANLNSRTYLFDFFSLLSDYKIYRVLRNGIREISYDPRYEILLTTNYLAINNRINTII